jgi:selenocysteine lyase/cysteine desulfurase
MAALSGLKNAIEEKIEIGIDTIQKHNQELLEYCTNELINKEVEFYGQDSSVMERAFIVMPASESIFHKLKSNNVFTTFREGYIRFGFHFYNSREDVDALIYVLSS